ncbi:PEP/pyruvate-binding domain-containing protein, partial [candidate division KSB1 bacterium]|nr:PEP/pyruvate-binding domain-containing protein [candidate division KSB1 bacterium]
MATVIQKGDWRPYLIPSGEETAAARIGQKSANLVRLQQHQLPIPSSWCLTADAFHDFLAQGTLQLQIGTILSNSLISDAAKARQIETLILAVDLPDRLSNELREFPFAAGRWAVRSSATVEDLLGASFAGLYESFLNLTGYEAVMKAIRRAWASLWSERALTYRRQRNIESTTAAMALLIQEMGPAQWSGVIFTRDPMCPDSKV